MLGVGVGGVREDGAVANPVEALSVTLGRITDLVEACADADFLRETRCTGWCVQDLLFHVLLDAQRGLVVLAQPVDTEADTDAVGYWSARSDQVGNGESTSHARFVRRAAMAYAAPAGLVAQWKDTSRAVVAAFHRADPQARVQTQGHVMTVEDFCSTLVVEAALHLLDLRTDAAEWGLPPAVTSRVRGTLEALLGEPAPRDWDDLMTALVLAGRQRPPEGVSFERRIPVLR